MSNNIKLQKLKLKDLEKVMQPFNICKASLNFIVTQINKL